MAVLTDAAIGSRTIEGLIGLQTCNENTCLTPHGVLFEATLQVAEQASTSQPASLVFSKASYAAVARAKADTMPPPMPAPPSPMGRAAAPPSPLIKSRTTRYPHSNHRICPRPPACR